MMAGEVQQRGPVAVVRWVDRADSTFSLIGEDAAHGFCVAAHTQTAGRGQRGNSWEAEPGANLTFSICLRPGNITPPRQFELSMLVAIACCDFMRGLVPQPERIRLKWPNDIYYDDLKLGGILIEQSLSGNRIDRSVAGIGININQIVFVNDAPNPVSLSRITGQRYELATMMQNLADAIVTGFDEYEKAPDPDELLGRYRRRLWRNRGTFPYRDTATGHIFSAAITDIDPAGPITLTDTQGQSHTYAFKEVEAIR